MSASPATVVQPAQGNEQRADEDLATVLEWLRDYVSKPSPHLGRRGAVCPFVPPALNAAAVRLSFHYDTNADPDLIRSVLLTELLQFHGTAEPPGSSGTSLASLLAVFPHADPAGWAVIDRVHGDLKDIAVANGLMIGQFHPACVTSAVRNPSFAVSRSPIALVAIRHMAPHDVLFLHDRREWFEAYHGRFGRYFGSRRVRDMRMCQLYDEAVRKYGLETARTAAPGKQDCGRSCQDGPSPRSRPEGPPVAAGSTV